MKIAVFALSIFLCANTADASVMGKPSNFLTINSGLVGWWTMDGKDMNWTTGRLSDASGNGNTGIVVNMATSTSPVKGKLGQALIFNGSSSYVGIGNSVISAVPVTMCAWVKPSLVSNGSSYSILDNVAMSLAVTEADGAEEFSFYNNNAQISTPYGSRYAAGAWYHTCATVDAGNNGIIYVNGVLAAGPTNLGSAVGLTNMFIGARTGPSQLFSGSIDDARVYNRVLSVNEVTALYNSGGSKISSTARSSNPTVENGLVGHWTMDGKDTNWATGRVTDTSGNGNAGIVSGMATSTSPVKGKIGQGLYFDGTSSYVQIPTAASLRPSNVTVNVWVKPDVNASVSYAAVIRSPYDREVVWNSPYVSWSIGREGLTNKVQWLLNAGSVPDVFGTADVWNKSEWQMLTLTYNGTDMVAYVNGVLDKTQAAGGPIVYDASNPDLIIGARSADALGEYYSGGIDDLRIYNRALSLDEITKLYNSGTANKMSATPKGVAGQGLNSGLVGWWTMDGKDVNWNTNRVLDKSGQGNNALMTGISTSTSPVKGKLGQAFKFIRTNYFKAPDSVSTRVNGDFSVSSWVKANAYNSNGSTADPIVYAGTTDGCYHSWTLNIGMDSRFWMTVEPTTCSYTEGTVKSPGIINLNQWYNVSSTFNNATGDLIMYVDGVQVDQRTVVGRHNSDAGISVGADPAFQYWNEGLDGIIDDVRVYNRVLSATEMKQIYNLGR